MGPLSLSTLSLGLRAGTRVPAPRLTEEGDEILFDAIANPLLESATLWVPDVHREILEYLRERPDEFYSLPPRRFEEVIAAVFKNQGFDVELTPESNDGGYDVLAVRNDLYTGPSTYLIECKRYAADNRVGVGVVRSLLGVVKGNPESTKGILATTSYFTRGAKRFEEENLNRLSLSDYDVLRQWLWDLSAMQPESSEPEE